MLSDYNNEQIKKAKEIKKKYEKEKKEKENKTELNNKLKKIKKSLNILCDNIEFEYNIDDMIKEIIKEEKLEDNEINKNYAINITKRNFLKYFINKIDCIIFEKGKIDYINEEEKIFITFNTKDDKIVRDNLDYIIKEFQTLDWLIKNIKKLNDNIKERERLKIKYNNHQNSFMNNKKYIEKEEYYNNLENKIIENMEYYIKCLLILNEGNYNNYKNVYKEYLNGIFVGIEIKNKEEKENIYNKIFSKISKE